MLCLYTAHDKDVTALGRADLRGRRARRERAGTCVSLAKGTGQRATGNIRLRASGYIEAPSMVAAGTRRREGGSKYEVSNE